MPTMFAAVKILRSGFKRLAAPGADANFIGNRVGEEEHFFQKFGNFHEPHGRVL